MLQAGRRHAKLLCSYGITASSTCEGSAAGAGTRQYKRGTCPHLTPAATPLVVERVCVDEQALPKQP